jgi:hypothetical protein
MYLRKKLTTSGETWDARLNKSSPASPTSNRGWKRMVAIGYSVSAQIEAFRMNHVFLRAAAALTDSPKRPKFYDRGHIPGSETQIVIHH